MEATLVQTTRNLWTFHIDTRRYTLYIPPRPICGAKKRKLEQNLADIIVKTNYDFDSVSIAIEKMGSDRLAIIQILNGMLADIFYQKAMKITK